MTQSRKFLDGLGDQYYLRNRDSHLRYTDPDKIVALVAQYGLQPKSILEIGCGDGRRLSEFCDAGAACFGVDPSAMAIKSAQARDPRLHLSVGTAAQILQPDAKFDLVIFGFCLYLCDRADLFRIAAEADRVLCENGAIAILDFDVRNPYRKIYKHASDVYSHKMQYRDMFLWNPAYRLVSHSLVQLEGAPRVVPPDESIGLSFIVKESSGAFPLREAE